MKKKIEVDFSVLEGKAFAKIDVYQDVRDGSYQEQEIRFTTIDNRVYVMQHDYECSENVNIEDICGDVDDLIGYPILLAEKVTSEENPKPVDKASGDDSCTWTFYKLATVKGAVTIRWYGNSNGYYSTEVSLFEEKDIVDYGDVDGSTLSKVKAASTVVAVEEKAPGTHIHLDQIDATNGKSVFLIKSDDIVVDMRITDKNNQDKA